jgi:hypothetical protein
MFDTTTADEGGLEKTMRQIAATITPITKSISLPLFFIVAELMIKNRSTLILFCYILTGTVYRIYKRVLNMSTPFCRMAAQTDFQNNMLSPGSGWTLRKRYPAISGADRFLSISLIPTE